MFGVGNILGHVAKGSSIAGALKLSPQVGKMMAPGVPKAMGMIGKHPPHAGGLTANLGIKLDPSQTQKALYMAVLTAAIDKAHDSKLFNLETQINDLFVKLGNLRSSPADMSALHEAIATHPQGLMELQKLLQTMGSVTKQAISNLK